MPKTIIAEDGDCLINLSYQEGFSWDTVWNHPNNISLHNQRKKLNIIKKGDTIFVPDLVVAEFTRNTDQLHKFVVKSRSIRFTLTLFDRGVPRAKERYVLQVMGRSKQGCTDENGTLIELIPPDARTGTLLVGQDQQEFAIDFGYVDPIEEISGVKTRLQNLGYYEGAIDDEESPETTAAIAEFQRSVNISGEGELTDDTRKALVRVHGS